MSGFKPMKAGDFNVDNVKFSPVKKLDNGANIIYTNYDSGSIYIQSPELDIPFDSGTFFEDKPGTGKCPVKVSLKSHDTEGSIKDFHDKIGEFDNYIKKMAKENSVAWFKKKNMSAEKIDNLYTPMLKVSVDSETGEPNGKYPPQFTFKVVKRDHKVLCKCYDSDKNLLNVEDTEQEDYKSLEDLLKKGSKVRMLLKCNGLWIAGGKFGCTWKAEQVKIKAAPGFTDYAFLEDSDEEDTHQKIDSSFVESSDDEGE